MKRRAFIRSTGGALLGLLGQGIMPGTAAGKQQGEGAPGRQTVTLFLGGDVMTGRGIDQVLPNPSDPTLHEGNTTSALEYVKLAEAANGPIPRAAEFDYIWGDALEVMDEARPDARIVNLETAITTHDGHWKSKRIHFRMHPENAGCLAAARIDCCALANNHALDWGYEGLQETLATLKGAGIHAAGAGDNIDEARAPAVIPLGETGRLLVYSIATRSSGVGKFWIATDAKPGINEIYNFDARYSQAMLERIRSDKRPGDLVVASIHWGRNWGYMVPEGQRHFARELIDAGVDVIHGHSSHHAKGIEVIRGRPVIYGCGDLIDDYEGISGENDRYRGELCLLYFVTLDAASGQLQGLEMRPMRIRNFRLNHASAEEAQWLEEMLLREGQKFGTSVTLEENLALNLGWIASPQA